MEERIWLVSNYYGSLGDIFAKFSYLNLKKEENLDVIDDECFVFLSNMVGNPTDINDYFAYDLGYDKSGDKVTIKPKNILCALWFIGVFPDNNGNVIKFNRYENQKNIYTFEEKTGKLKVIKK